MYNMYRHTVNSNTSIIIFIYLDECVDGANIGTVDLVRSHLLHNAILQPQQLNLQVLTHFGNVNNEFEYNSHNKINAFALFCITQRADIVTMMFVVSRSVCDVMH